MGIFPIRDPSQDFFQKLGSVTFVPIWYSNFVQKIRKSNGRSPKIFKGGLTDGPRTDKGDIRPQINRGPNRNLKLLFKSPKKYLIPI